MHSARSPVLDGLVDRSSLTVLVWMDCCQSLSMFRFREILSCLAPTVRIVLAVVFPANVPDLHPVPVSETSVLAENTSRVAYLSTKIAKAYQTRRVPKNDIHTK
jgi:hypothetical protein